jgi:hypothetical protein
MWWVNLACLTTLPVYIRVHVFDYLTMVVLYAIDMILNVNVRTVKQDIFLGDVSIRHAHRVSEIELMAQDKILLSNYGPM